MTHTIAALPTGTRMNPAHPQAAEFYDPMQTAYVLFKQNDNRTRPTRILTSFGLMHDTKVGSMLELYHDQTGAFLGRYEVVGIHHFASGECTGDVPDLNNILHCVVK